MNIRKRDGKVVPFDAGKIRSAVLKALSATGMPSDSVAERVAKDAVEALKGVDEPQVEQIQDAVETALMKRGLTAAAKAYILYRDEHARAREALRVRRAAGSRQSVTDKSMMIATRDSVSIGGWDRGALARALASAGLGPTEADNVAKQVEDKLIATGLRTVNAALVREMANSVMADLGLDARLKDETVYTVPKDFVDGLMGEKVNENSNISNNNPEAVAMAISGLVQKQYLFDRVLSDDIAVSHSTGRIYVHDADFPTRVYCSSHSIEYLKKYGLRGLLNLNTSSKPAKSASVLTGHLNTFLASMQANYAGALGLGFVNVFYAPLVDSLDDREMHQVAQELVFNISQNAFSRGGQTLFVDINVCSGVPSYLKNVPAIGPGGKYQFRAWQGAEGERLDTLEEAVDGNGDWCLWWTHPDTGSRLCVLREHDGKQEFPDTGYGQVKTYGDYQDAARRFAHAMLDVWGEGDADGRLFAFPKCDFHVSAESFTDPEQHEVFQHACRLAASNGSTYFVFDRDSVSLASCCFTGDTEVLTRGGVGSPVHLCTFKELADARYGKMRTNLTVYHDGGWSMAKLVKLPGTGKRIFGIRTVNHKLQKVTEDHIVPTLDGDKPASQVTTDDYLLFSTAILEESKSNSSVQRETMSFAQGILIGAYLGDGSIEQRVGQKPAVHFSLNREKYNALAPYIKTAMAEWDVDGELVLHTPYNNVYPVYIASWGLVEKVRSWVYGSYAYEKDLNLDALKMSSDFRKGIVHGLYATDGGNSNRIYTTSERMVKSLEVLFTSLGVQTIIDVSDRTGDGQVVIRGKAFNRNYPVYCVRWYENGTRRQYNGLYRIKNSSVYYKVDSIEELPEEDSVYCFQITDDNEPYFTLPSGIITHNCRLRVQITDMSLLTHPERLRTCGFMNVTVNVPQAAYRAAHAGKPTLEGLLEQVDEAMDLAVKAELQKKAFVETLMSGPGKPLWQLGKTACDGRPYLETKDCTYIIGMIGVNDAVHYLLGKEMHESEEAMDMALRIAGHMYLRTKEYTKQYGLQFKLEESPAESAARKLAKTDLVYWREDALKVYKGWDEDHAFYTNSIHLSADAPVSLTERIKAQSRFNSIIEAGAITHAFIGEERPSAEAIEQIVRNAYLLTQSAQITFSPEVTYCRVCGAQMRGIHDRCEECGADDVLAMTRVVGYFSAVRSWNASKQSELSAREHGDYAVAGVELAGEVAE